MKGAMYEPHHLSEMQVYMDSACAGSKEMSTMYRKAKKERLIMENQVQKQDPDQMIRLAIEKGADLEKLEKLLSLKERYEQGEAKKEYHKAMAAFKANAPKIVKDKKVAYGNTRYRHASLFHVVEVISAELSKHGLSATWQTKQNGVVEVTCRITHVQGHSEETTLSANADTSGSKNSIQAIGSTITYLQRYTLLALTGLATSDQDDDGRGAQPVECIDKDQLSRLTDYIDELGVDQEKFCSFYGIESLDKLPKDKLDAAIKALSAKRGKVKK